MTLPIISLLTSAAFKNTDQDDNPVNPLFPRFPYQQRRATDHRQSPC